MIGVRLVSLLVAKRGYMVDSLAGWVMVVVQLIRLGLLMLDLQFLFALCPATKPWVLLLRLRS
jgi:hypothetical protein